MPRGAAAGGSGGAGGAGGGNGNGGGGGQNPVASEYERFLSELQG